MTTDAEDEVLETRIAKLWLDEQGIVWFETRPDVGVATIADVEEFFAAIVRLGDGNKVLLMADARRQRLSISNRETRNYFARSDDVGRVVVAFAALVNSPVVRVGANFFLKISKPTYPTRIFNDEAEAIAWLKSFMA